jgi:hypothetical protein
MNGNKFNESEERNENGISKKQFSESWSKSIRLPQDAFQDGSHVSANVNGDTIYVDIDKKM